MPQYLLFLVIVRTQISAKMKFLVLAMCVCAASAATFSNPALFAAQAVVSAPVLAAKTVYQAGKEAAATVLRADSEVTATGYNYAYETDNGISGQSSGTLKNVADSAAVVAQGGYRYVAPDGTPVEVTYIADENGYQPQSNILPKAPEIPAAILRSLEYIANHPSAESGRKF